ncbi:MAG: hypothetical protein V1819_03060 [bacterium]
MNKIIDFIKKIITWERMRHALYGQIIIGIFIIIFGFIEIFYGLKILSFANVLDILKIIMWPITVIFISLFFRKVLSYFFFSLEEFNFFGNRGKLNNPKEMIEEKVEKILKEMAEKEITEKRINDLQIKINEEKKRNEEISITKERILIMAQEAVDIAKKLEKANDELISKINK